MNKIIKLIRKFFLLDIFYKLETKYIPLEITNVKPLVISNGNIEQEVEDKIKSFNF